MYSMKIKDQIIETWKIIYKNNEIAGEYFYSNLFKEHPSIEKLFKTEFDEHKVKLIDLLNYIVSRLDDFNVLIPQIRKLGIKHNGYGVKKKHYPIVGNILIQTLRNFIGEMWNDELEMVWIDLYNQIANIMMNPKDKQNKIDIDWSD